MTDNAVDKTHEPPPSPKPPRGPRSVTVLAWVIFGVIMLVAGAAWSDFVWSPFTRMWEAARPAAEPADHDETTGSEFYTCGMHPWVILPEPGLCPICHMDLTPLDPDKFTGEIMIDPVVTQNIGVRIGPVTKGPVEQAIRTVGTVDYDETRVRDVNIKVSGWIEKLHVDYLGAEVEAGQPLFDLYAPDLFEAQEQYLLEYRKKDMAGDPMRGVDLLEAARTRLEYYDITPEQIRQLEQTGAAAKAMAIHSPHRGVVIAKHANEGMRVDEGMQVYRIADLSTVWVMVTLYEYQLPFVQAGQRAIMTLPYIPGQEFEGKVIYVYPYLDAQTRQVSVRLEFDNPTGLLKPGMYANVELRSTLAGERTLAPRTAILDTGERQIAFVSLGEGRFEPRDVHVGVETVGGNVEILDGLRPGEMVVTSGQFLLDSETTIRESLAKMIRGGQRACRVTAAGRVGPQRDHDGLLRDQRSARRRHDGRHHGPRPFRRRGRRPAPGDRDSRGPALLAPTRRGRHRTGQGAGADRRAEHRRGAAQVRRPQRGAGQARAGHGRAPEPRHRGAPAPLPDVPRGPGRVCLVTAEGQAAQPLHGLGHARVLRRAHHAARHRCGPGPGAHGGTGARPGGLDGGDR
ncbi:MAG: efflux RND transporter periplasmic adaptor subunit [Planctomycetota bacterium]|jgi:RND family efflux transporter MFP subunit